MPVSSHLAIKAIFRQCPDIPFHLFGRGRPGAHRSAPRDVSSTTPRPQPPTGLPGTFTFSYDVALNSQSKGWTVWTPSSWVDLDPSRKTKYLKAQAGQKLTLSPTRGPGGHPALEPDFDRLRYDGNRVHGAHWDDEGNRSRALRRQKNLVLFPFAPRSMGDPKYARISPYNFGPASSDVVMNDQAQRTPGEKSRTVLHVGL